MMGGGSGRSSTPGSASSPGSSSNNNNNNSTSSINNNNSGGPSAHHSPYPHGGSPFHQGGVVLGYHRSGSPQGPPSGGIGAGATGGRTPVLDQSTTAAVVNSIGKGRLLSRNMNGTLVMTSHPTNESELQLYRVLQRANLLYYYDTFISQGGDDVQQLCEAGEEEFLEIMALVGMASKPLHVRRLQKALQEWVQNPGLFQAPLVPPPSPLTGASGGAFLSSVSAGGVMRASSGGNNSTSSGPIPTVTVAPSILAAGVTSSSTSSSSSSVGGSVVTSVFGGGTAASSGAGCGSSATPALLAGAVHAAVAAVAAQSHHHPGLAVGPPPPPPPGSVSSGSAAAAMPAHLLAAAALSAAAAHTPPPSSSGSPTVVHLPSLSSCSTSSSSGLACGPPLVAVGGRLIPALPVPAAVAAGVSPPPSLSAATSLLPSILTTTSTVGLAAPSSCVPAAAVHLGALVRGSPPPSSEPSRSPASLSAATTPTPPPVALVVTSGNNKELGNHHSGSNSSVANNSASSRAGPQDFSTHRVLRSEARESSSESTTTGSNNNNNLSSRISSDQQATDSGAARHNNDEPETVSSPSPRSPPSSVGDFGGSQASHPGSSTSPALQLTPVLVESQIQRIADTALALVKSLPDLEPKHPNAKKKICKELELVQYVMNMADDDSRKMEEIRKFSAIYGRFDCKRKPEKPLTLHEVSVNEAAAQICRLVPAMLTRRDELFPLARQVVRDSGYQYSKGHSRSTFNLTGKLFNGDEGPFKRMRFSEDSEMTQRRRERLEQISEEIRMISDRLEELRTAGGSARHQTDLQQISQQIELLQSKQQQLMMERDDHQRMIRFSSRMSTSSDPDRPDTDDDTSQRSYSNASSPSASLQAPPNYVLSASGGQIIAVQNPALSLCGAFPVVVSSSSGGVSPPPLGAIRVTSPSALTARGTPPTSAASSSAPQHPLTRHSFRSSSPATSMAPHLKQEPSSPGPTAMSASSPPPTGSLLIREKD